MISADNLAKKDIFGASDPYVRIDLVTVRGDEVVDSVLTKTKKRTLNPRWEEEFLFRLKPSEHKLVMEVPFSIHSKHSEYNAFKIWRLPASAHCHNCFNRYLPV